MLHIIYNIYYILYCTYCIFPIEWFPIYFMCIYVYMIYSLLNGEPVGATIYEFPNHRLVALKDPMEKVIDDISRIPKLRVIDDIIRSNRFIILVGFF